MPDRCVLRAAACAFALLSASFAQASQVELLSKRHPSFDGAEVFGQGVEAALSADGLWVAFNSTSLNLAPGQSDANSDSDIFLLERLSGTVTLVSHAAGFPNTAGGGASSEPSVSADGRYVAFLSRADNLVSGQVSPGFIDHVFLYDRIAGTTTLVSHAAGSATAGANSSSMLPAISEDGNYVTFVSAATNLVPGATDANNTQDVFLYERATGTLSLVSRSADSPGTAANGQSWYPEISADGSFVLYFSQATNVVSGQSDTNFGLDVFLYHRSSGANALVSHAAGLPATAGNRPATISFLGLSDDGAYAVFLDESSNLVAGQIDSTSTYDAFLYTRATGTVTLLSHADGAAATAAEALEVSISGDGAWILFESPGTNLVPGQIDVNDTRDVFLVQRATGAVMLVSRQSGTAATAGNAVSGGYSRLSADGRYVAFSSQATNLVAGQIEGAVSTDIFLFDRVSGTAALASHADGSSVTAANQSSYPQTWMLSADGAYMVYRSEATDLTDDVDANAHFDLFLYSRSTGNNTAISISEPVISVTPDGESFGLPSRDGRFAVLSSQGTDLVEGQTDANDGGDVFLVDRLAGTTTLVSHADGSPATTADRYSYSPWISADGRWVVFESEATDLIPDIGPPPGIGSRFNVYLYSRDSGALTLVSRSAADPTKRSNGSSFRQVISGDGRYVAFGSTGSNLVPGQTELPGIGGDDVFLYDRVTGGMALVSHSPSSPLQAVNGSASNQLVGISLDGRFVVFPSLSGNLVAGQTDGNGGSDLFLYDRNTGAVTLVTRAAGSATTTANGQTQLIRPAALSADGRFLAYTSWATDLVPGQVDANAGEDVFLFDRVAGTTTLLSRKSGTLATTGNGGCLYPMISDDGRYTAFSCTATDLVPGQIDLNPFYDAFLYDRITGTLSLLSQDGVSTNPLAVTFATSLSPDGRFVAFQSSETMRIPGQADQNAGEDSFVLDRIAGTTRLASRSRISRLTTGNVPSGGGWLAGGGSLVFFSSLASDFVEGDYNHRTDMYVSSTGSTPATDFFTLTPCRVADTRASGSLTSGAAVLFELHDACGIPDTARAVALNVTALQGSGPGYLTLYPGDADLPLAGAVSFGAGSTRASNAILPLAYDGSGTLAVLPAMTGGGTVHVILDVVGWFE